MVQSLPSSVGKPLQLWVSLRMALGSSPPAGRAGTEIWALLDGRLAASMTAWVIVGLLIRVNIRDLVVSTLLSLRAGTELSVKT